MSKSYVMYVVILRNDDEEFSYTTCINISHHPKTLLFRKHERYLDVTRRAIYPPCEHRKDRHGPLLIRVLSIKWTNKKPEARSDTLEETSGEIRSRLDSHRGRKTEAIRRKLEWKRALFSTGLFAGLSRVDFVSNCTFCGAPRWSRLLPSRRPFRLLAHFAKRFSCVR